MKFVQLTNPTHRKFIVNLASITSIAEGRNYDGIPCTVILMQGGESDVCYARETVEWFLRLFNINDVAAVRPLNPEK